jgi:hypothetical protein
MAEIDRKFPPPGSLEEHGLVTDVVVPIVAGGVGGAVSGAVSATVSNHLNQNQPSESSPPPTIELPPVDRD